MSQSRLLVQTVERLSTAKSLESVTHIVAHAARELTGSQGSTFVLREEDQCYYADEDSISPLWKGRRFAIDQCVSGWAMQHQEVVLVPDVERDSRVLKDEYRSTFVKSLCVVPIREDNPIGAIGNYWSNGHQPSDEEIKFLQILANTSATALENLELRNTLNAQNRNFEFQLHSLAHDLKSPMATVMGFAELLQMRLSEKTCSKELEYASSIQRVGQRICRQIDCLLNLYKFTHGSIQKREIDLSEFAEQIVRDLKALEPHRRMEVNIEQNLYAYADSDLMRLVLENLFSNAFKYSRKKDSAFIKFARDPLYPWTFVIEDNGAGFEQSKAHRLFQPFGRLHNNNEFEGTGLGLASVAKILELHGGFIRAEGAPSKGARFIFSLPIAPVQTH